MCGIAGYSLNPASSAPRTLAAQALLAGIAERGADAVGYAHRGLGGEIHLSKQRSGATALLDELHIPLEATQALVHVRDYTKGHPRIEANNHPIRHGRVVGIHNGIILNDEEIFARYGFERAEPEMTVDSEAIFALAEHAEGHAEALEELTGAMATAWFDERLPSTLFLARAVGRPLWIGNRNGQPRALLRLDPRRARGARADAAAHAAQARARRGHPPARRGRPRGCDRAVPARSLVCRGDDPPRRTGATRGPQLPAAPRRDRARDRLAALSRRPVGRDVRRPPRAGARGRGTETRPRRAGRRSSGRSAIR